MQLHIPSLSKTIKSRLDNLLPSRCTDQIDLSIIESLCKAYLKYLETNSTDSDKYLLLRGLNFYTCGVFGFIFNDVMIGNSVSLNNNMSLSDSKCSQITTNLNNQGFALMPQTFVDNHYQNLAADLSTISYECVDIDQSSNISFVGKPDYKCEHSGMKYSAKIEDLLRLPSVLNLIADPQLLAIVEQYLGGKVFIRSVDSWWKTPFIPKKYSLTADHFHRDCDHNRWLNLFFFLTPVSSSDGAHVFCPGTHQRHYSDLSKELYGDGRYEDDLIMNNGIVPIAHESNSPFVVLEDTWGFHKASRCRTNSRLVLQIRFVRSSFGAQVPSVDKSSLLSVCNSVFTMPQSYSSQLIKSLTPLLKPNVSPERACSLF